MFHLMKVSPLIDELHSVTQHSIEEPGQLAAIALMATGAPTGPEATELRTNVGIANV